MFLLRKNQDQVRKMIAGSNGVYICDECIELCSEILEEELGNEEEERPDFSGINEKFSEGGLRLR